MPIEMTECSEEIKESLKTGVPLEQLPALVVSRSWEETAFALVAAVCIVILFGSAHIAGLEVTPAHIGGAIIRLLPAVFWPWAVWLIIRAIKGRSGAPDIRKFVLTGGLILMPLLTVSSVVRAFSAVEAYVESSVEELNRDLPMMVDEGLRLDSYEASGKTLVMNITTVGMRAEDIDVESWMDEYEVRARQSVCDDLGSRQILESGVIYEYRYIDEVGAPVFSTRIAETDCD